MIHCPLCNSEELERLHYEPCHSKLGHLDGKYIGKSTKKCLTCGNVFDHYTEIPKQKLRGKRLVKGGYIYTR